MQQKRVPKPSHPRPAPSRERGGKYPEFVPSPPWSLCENPSLHVIPRTPPFLVADDDPSPEGFGPQGEESRIALKRLRARFLAPLGMTGLTAFSHRLPWGRGFLDLIGTGEGVHPSPYYADISRAAEPRLSTAFSAGQPVGRTVMPGLPAQKLLKINGRELSME
jgi:hypothetical protein